MLTAATQTTAFHHGPILELIEAVDACSELTPDLARRLLGHIELQPADVMPWADFDHPVTDGYGRKLVFAGARFELMVMSWRPGDYSAIHDHGATQWGAVRYLGPAEHVVFREHEGRLGVHERRMQTPGSVCAVDHDLIHLMGNPGTTPFLSIHLYGVDCPTPLVTGDARIFDLYERRIQRTDGGVFFGLPESEIRRREPCPQAEPEAILLHHRLMHDRIGRILEAGLGNEALARRQRDLSLAMADLDAGPVAARR